MSAELQAGRRIDDTAIANGLGESELSCRGQEAPQRALGAISRGWRGLSSRTKKWKAMSDER